MSEFLNAAGGSAVAIVVAAVLLGLLGYAFRTWIRAFVAGSIAHDFNVKLEEQKNELKRLTDQLNAVQSTGNAALIEAQRAAAEKRVAAADELWQEVLRLRQEAPPALFLLDMASFDGLQRPETIARLRTMVSESASTSRDRWATANPKIEAVRPFLGEETYTLFHIYRAVFGRIFVLLKEDLKSNRVGKWYEDTSIRRLLDATLSPDEIQRFEEFTNMRAQFVGDAIEAKILERLRKVIAGEMSTEEGLAQARKIQRVMQTIDAEEGASR